LRGANNNKGKTAREREEIAELYRLYAAQRGAPWRRVHFRVRGLGDG
jgi:hypothetical protein